jgi:CRP-like cAMP-binding protein
MAERLQMIDLASRLRQSNLFEGLSVAEATVLGTFMERQSFEAGDVIVREGEIGDDLFLIESGNADVQVASGRDVPIHVATLGPGDFFGEIALLTGAERMADVVAATAMGVLRLTKDAFTLYLAHATEVDRQITRTAMSRTRDTSRKLSEDRS